MVLPGESYLTLPQYIGVDGQEFFREGTAPDFRGRTAWLANPPVIDRGARVRGSAGSAAVVFRGRCRRRDAAI